MSLGSLGCDATNAVRTDAVPEGASSEKGVPLAVLRSLRARYGDSIPGLNEAVSGKLRPERVTGGSTSLSQAVLESLSPGNVTGGAITQPTSAQFDVDPGSGTAPAWDILRYSIAGWVGVGGTGYYVGGYMEESKGAAVTAGVEGWGNTTTYVGLTTFVHIGTATNQTQWTDSWSNTCAYGEHQSIGGFGQIGATQSVSNGLYLPPTAYFWGPRNKSIFDECNPPPPRKVNAVALSGGSSVYIGEALSLSATATDNLGASASDLCSSFTWSSSDASVASVSGGSVRGEGTGSATISATCSGVTGSLAVSSSTRPCGEPLSPTCSSSSGGSGTTGGERIQTSAFVGSSSSSSWNSSLTLVEITVCE